MKISGRKPSAPEFWGHETSFFRDAYFNFASITLQFAEALKRGFPGENFKTGVKPARGMFAERSDKNRDLGKFFFEGLKCCGLRQRTAGFAFDGKHRPMAAHNQKIDFMRSLAPKTNRIRGTSSLSQTARTRR